MLQNMPFQDQEFKKNYGRGTALPPYSLGTCGISILVPSALVSRSKFLDLPLAPATVLAAAPSAMSL